MQGVIDKGSVRHYSEAEGRKELLDRSSGFFSPLIDSFSLRYASKDTSSLPHNKISHSHTQVLWWPEALAWGSNQACERRHGARERSGRSATAIHACIASSCACTCSTRAGRPSRCRAKARSMAASMRAGCGGRISCERRAGSGVQAVSIHVSRKETRAAWTSSASSPSHGKTNGKSRESCAASVRRS